MKIYILFFAVLFTNSLFAQKPKQTVSKEETSTDDLKYWKEISESNRPKKLSDSAQQRKKEYDAILEFMSHFDSMDMGKWKFDSENNAADVKSLQQNLMLLIGQSVIGFDDMKKSIQSKTVDLIFYNTEPNVLMKASTEYIVEKNSKTSYCAFYNNQIEKDLSLQAFLAMPAVNKSTVPLRVEKAKLVNNAIEKTRYNLYLSDKIAASYFINKNDNSIQVYEPGY